MDSIKFMLVKQIPYSWIQDLPMEAFALIVAMAVVGTVIVLINIKRELSTKTLVGISALMTGFISLMIVLSVAKLELKSEINGLCLNVMKENESIASGKTDGEGFLYLISKSMNKKEFLHYVGVVRTQNPSHQDVLDGLNAYCLESKGLNAYLKVY